MQENVTSEMIGVGCCISPMPYRRIGRSEPEYGWQGKPDAERARYKLQETSFAGDSPLHLFLDALRVVNWD